VYGANMVLISWIVDNLWFDGITFGEKVKYFWNFVNNNKNRLLCSPLRYRVFGAFCWVFMDAAVHILTNPYIDTLSGSE
jgi:hypothetical protein